MWNDMLVSPSASPWERTGFVLASFALFIIVPAMDKREVMCMYMCVCLYVGCTCGGMQRSASSGVCEAGLLTGLFGKSGWPASTGNPVSASQVLRWQVCVHVCLLARHSERRDSRLFRLHYHLPSVPGPDARQTFPLSHAVTLNLDSASCWVYIYDFWWRTSLPGCGFFKSSSLPPSGSPAPC